jgi:hypothetical protein
VSVEELYRRDGERLWRALLLYSGDREVASDSVAEAFGQCTWRSPRSARRYALCVLFDFVFFGFVVPIAVGVLAVRGARHAQHRWVAVAWWTVAAVLALFVLVDVAQLVTL